MSNTNNPTSPNCTLVETEEQLEFFFVENKSVEWMAFDTEFIPEKYYKNKLCLISVTSPKGNYVIDALKLKRMDGFLRLLENTRILKITHAGDNDYQILVSAYGAKIRNIFDTQLAYGFLNSDYPLGLQFLVEKELKIRIKKEELKSDWENRPLRDEQLQYAIEDVVSLYPLMKALKAKLKKTGKLLWAMEENNRWENTDYFNSGSFDLADTVNGMLGRHLNYRQKVFLLRLYRWRTIEAQKRNCPLNQVLKTQFINSIAKNMEAGKTVLLKDRTIPHAVVNQLWPMLERLYNNKITYSEREMLKHVPKEENGDAEVSIAMDMLYQVIKLKAVERGISPYMVISRREMSKMKNDRDYYPAALDCGWRRELLGDDLLEWLKKRNPIDIRFKNDTCTLTMQDWKKIKTRLDSSSPKTSMWQTVLQATRRLSNIFSQMGTKTGYM
ncbi:MAG: ribonuclease D [Candidatus Omnitrophota bacterium]